MTFEQEEMIRQLKYKMRLLMAKFQTLKRENENLAGEKNELLTVIEKQKRQIGNLEQQYNTAKLAKSVLIPSEDRESAKAQIKRIVREIDECIALLNK
jgi:predicted  nucleic acid-binding Zn-ribbon protein